MKSKRGQFYITHKKWEYWIRKHGRPYVLKGMPCVNLSPPVKGAFWSKSRLASGRANTGPSARSMPNWSSCIGISGNPSTRSARSAGGVKGWYKTSLKICNWSSPVGMGFRREIFGICGIFTANIPAAQNCNHWLQKSVGPKIWSFSVAARTT